MVSLQRWWQEEHHGGKPFPEGEGRRGGVRKPLN